MDKIDEESIGKIKQFIKDEIDSSNKELKEDLPNIIKKCLEEYDEHDPVETVKKYNEKAMLQIKKDIEEEMKQDMDEKRLASLNKKAKQMDETITKVIQYIDKIQKDQNMKDDLLNPFYRPSLKKRIISVFRKKHEAGARNSLALLFTGIGLIVLSSGVWDASLELLSIQGSIVTGLVMVALVGILQRKKVFAIFGQE